MDIAKQISKEYADKNTCYANDSDLQYRAIRKAVEYGYEYAKKQLMANAIDAEVLENFDGKDIEYDETILDKKLSNCNVFDKFKVVVIKETES